MNFKWLERNTKATIKESKQVFKFTFKGISVHGKVALGGVKVIWPGMSPHHARVSLHQPIGHLAFRWHHLRWSDKRLLAGVLALAKGEFRNMVFDFNLSRSAVVKLDGEGGVALHHRGRGRSFIGCVFRWNHLDLLLCSFGLWLQFFGSYFKVTGIPSTGANGLCLMFRGRCVNLLSGIFFLFFCEKTLTYKH